MTTVDAIYERGVLRPIQPLDLTEGTRVRLTLQVPDLLVARRTTPEEVQRLLDEIAALPEEGHQDGFPGSDHDAALYGDSDER